MSILSDIGCTADVESYDQRSKSISSALSDLKDEGVWLASLWDSAAAVDCVGASAKKALGSLSIIRSGRQLAGGSAFVAWMQEIQD
eukprot:7778380-Prorocentrum_lima.AAC.1